MAGLDHSRIFTKYEDLSDNATYEMCQVVTDDFFFGLLEYIELVLGRKEARIIELLFGFEDGNIYNNNQVGEMYGVTGQRIRQLSRIYLRKLAEEGLPPLQYPS